MTFRDRTEAGRALGDALAPVLAPPFVVGAIPRGGVTVALPLVERFRAPLALVYASKLTAPAAQECERVADRFVSLVVDPAFQAVGQYYLDFASVRDDEVLVMLARAATLSTA